MDGPRGTIHSATDGPGGPSAVAMDGPGGPIIGGTIHCVTVPLNKTVVILLARAGKSARSLFNCISVTDGIEINEQYKSIGIGPLYTYKSNLKRFDYSYLFLSKVMADLNPIGYQVQDFKT